MPIRRSRRPQCFNPRLRMGGDGPVLAAARTAGVSIHASAWEATRSRRLEGVDAVFQSTPPHGRRQCILFSIHASAWEATRWRRVTARDPSFNPRLRMGGDLPSAFARTRRLASAWEATAQAVTEVIEVSIHASAWEATCRSGGEVFQSTPPHGRRLPMRSHGLKCWRFNPRLRMGGDRCSALSCVDTVSFQSTPPHGRRHEAVLTPPVSVLFQSTPPHGRRPGPGSPTGRIGFQSTPPHGRRLRHYI